jgi:S1-C subfamily serine protease
MRRLIAIALLIISSGFATAGSHSTDPVPANSTVSIGTRFGIGSGTVIARKGKTALILTNNHVVEDAPKGRKIYIFYNGEKFIGKLHTLSADPKHVDLALVVADLDCPAVEIATDEVRLGDAVRHFGHATGPQKGKVIEGTPFNGRAPSINSNMLSFSGDSGAGVFDSKNRLVAVNEGWLGDADADDPPQLGIGPRDIVPFLWIHARDWFKWESGTKKPTLAKR